MWLSAVYGLRYGTGYHALARLALSAGALESYSTHKNTANGGPAMTEAMTNALPPKRSSLRV